MAIIDPIYSIEIGRDVYHNNTNCTERNNIETVNVRAGTGGKRLCDHCKRLNTKESFNGLAGSGLLGGMSSLFKGKNIK